MEKNTALEALQSKYNAAVIAENERDLAAIAARETGASWNEIGTALGITKQRAQQRYSGDEREKIERRAAALEKGRQEGQRILAEIREKIYGTPAEPSKILDESVAGESVTPSIFLEPTAPAKPQKKAKKTIEQLAEGIDEKIREYRPVFRLDGPVPEVAQPGTGKGPHQCPNCKSTNHHGTEWHTVAMYPNCIPTKYDPPAVADYVNAHTIFAGKR